MRQIKSHYTLYNQKTVPFTPCMKETLQTITVLQFGEGLPKKIHQKNKQRNKECIFFFSFKMRLMLYLCMIVRNFFGMIAFIVKRERQDSRQVLQQVSRLQNLLLEGK